MPRRYSFILVDVFTATRFGGNQLAVFTDAAGLDAGEMQSLAHELNFSESTFVTVPEIPGAVRRVRIFTPTVELPMAGHPTVGTAWVLASRGEISLDGASVEATLQLEIGAIKVAVEGAERHPEFVWMTQRRPIFGAIRDDRGRIASALNIEENDLRTDLPIQIVSTGVPFLFVPIKSVEALGRCAPNERALAALFDTSDEKPGVYMHTAVEGRELRVRARMFAPHTVGIAEDPATGGAAGPFGAYAATYRMIPAIPRARFAIEQGVEMGRPSRIEIEVTRVGDTIGVRIGGRCVISGEGTMYV